MRITSWIALLQLVAVELASASHTLRPRQYDTREYYAVHLAPGAPPRDIARRLGLVFEGKIGELDDHYLLSGAKGNHDVIEEYQLRRKSKRDASDDGILFAEKQKLKRLVKRMPPPPKEKRLPSRVQDKELVQKLKHISDALDIRDPIFHEQWHLFNTVEKGHDVNVTGLWLEGITGRGSTVAIVDDGLDMYSDDLKDNYVSLRRRRASRRTTDHETVRERFIRLQRPNCGTEAPSRRRQTRHSVRGRDRGGAE